MSEKKKKKKRKSIHLHHINTLKQLNLRLISISEFSPHSPILCQSEPKNLYIQGKKSAINKMIQSNSILIENTNKKEQDDQLVISPKASRRIHNIIRLIQNSITFVSDYDREMGR